MFRRLLSRFLGETNAGSAKANGASVNLVSEEGASELPAPAHIGINAAPTPSPWTVSRIDRIVRRANAQPGDAQCLLEARHARHRLSRFWLDAPIDQLEELYSGPIGQAYRLLLRGPLPAQPLAIDENDWKQNLALQLENDFSAPQRLNLLLAVMPYCAAGKMRLSEPADCLPRWLLADYVACFAPELAGELSLPIGLLDQPRNSSPIETNRPGSMELAPVPIQAAAAPVPRLIPGTGGDAFPQFQNEEFVNRMVGLINLYTIDRSDAEVKLELARLRRLIGQIWLDVSPASLEALYNTSLGMIYRALLTSNFGGEPLNPDDLDICRRLTEIAVDMDHPAMAQSLLATMPFIPQGKMRLGPGQRRLPVWIQESFNSLAGLG